MSIRYTFPIMVLGYCSFSSAMDIERAKELQPSASQTSDHLSTPETDLRTLSNLSATPTRTDRSMSDFDSNLNSNANYNPQALFRFMTVEELHSPDFEQEGERIIRQSRTGTELDAMHKEDKRKLRKDPHGLMVEIEKLEQRNQELLLELTKAKAKLEDLERQQSNKRHCLCACLRRSKD